MASRKPGKIIEKIKIGGVTGKYDVNIRLIHLGRGEFAAECPALDLWVSGSDVTKIRKEMEAEILNTTAIEWKPFFMIDFDLQRWQGSGGEMRGLRDEDEGYTNENRPDFKVEGQFEVQEIERGTQTNGAIVWRYARDVDVKGRSSVYDGDPLKRREHEDTESRTVSLVPVTPENRAALVHIRTMFIELFRKSTQFFKQDVVLKNLTSGALLLGGPKASSNEKETQAELLSADSGSSSGRKHRRRA